MLETGLCTQGTFRASGPWLLFPSLLEPHSARLPPARPPLQIPHLRSLSLLCTRQTPVPLHASLQLPCAQHGKSSINSPVVTVVKDAAHTLGGDSLRFRDPMLPPGGHREGNDSDPKG